MLKDNFSEGFFSSQSVMDGLGKFYKIFYQIKDLYIPYKMDLINFNVLSDENKMKENITKEEVKIYSKFFL